MSSDATSEKNEAAITDSVNVLPETAYVKCPGFDEALAAHFSPQEARFMKPYAAGFRYLSKDGRTYRAKITLASPDVQVRHGLDYPFQIEYVNAKGVLARKPIKLRFLAEGGVLRERIRFDPEPSADPTKEETLQADAPCLVEERKNAVRKVFADHGVELIHAFGVDDPSSHKLTADYHTVMYDYLGTNRATYLAAHYRKVTYKLYNLHELVPGRRYNYIIDKFGSLKVLPLKGGVGKHLAVSEGEAIYASGELVLTRELDLLADFNSGSYMLSHIHALAAQHPDQPEVVEQLLKQRLKATSAALKLITGMEVEVMNLNPRIGMIAL